MSGRTFFDTNVLLYADDLSAGAKRELALKLIDEAANRGAGVLSTQVLQEYFVNATRKLGVAAGDARTKLELFAQTMDVVHVEVDLILGAIDLHRLHQLSFWDALVVKSAAVSGCRLLYSEDLQHGRVLEGVRFENPFLADEGPST